MAGADESIRAFLAVELGDSVRASLVDLIKRLGEGPTRISWVRPENLHVTLRFLGDVLPAQLDALTGALNESIQDFETFDLRVGGVGVFPNARRPSVVWAGVQAPPDSLFRVQELTEGAAQGIGLEAEFRPFRPHVTLGRVRGRRGIDSLTEALEGESSFDGGDFTVRAVSLFSSTLTRDGAEYRRIRGFPLACSFMSE